MVVAVVLLADALDVAALVGQPLLIELARLLLAEGRPTPVTLGLRGTGIGPVARLVLGQEFVEVELQLVPVAGAAMTEPDERRVGVRIQAHRPEPEARVGSDERRRVLQSTEAINF